MITPRGLGIVTAFAVLAVAPVARGVVGGDAGAGTTTTAGADAARHLKLLKSEPAANAAVASPTQVKLWFSQRPELAVTRVALKGPDGAERVLGPLARDAAAGAPIVAPVGAALAPGAWTIAWRTMAKDGHVLNGTVRFTVR